MKSLTQLTQLELVLLELVAKGQGKWSWYELANALSRRDVPRKPDMMVVLKKLAADGFVRRFTETNSPRDRWELTSEGSILLANATANRQRGKIRYAIAIKRINNNYSACVPDLPGCVATGTTLEEVEQQIKQAIVFHLEELREAGLPIPQSALCKYVEV
ncbi:MAG: type II toxin-antitoxin system HicB family antitoxin [Microcoleus sp.]